MTRIEAVAELQALWRVLRDDLDKAIEYCRQHPSAYADRALIRAHFSLVEGMSFALRQVTLASLRGTDLLTEDEMMLLREERPTIDEQGRPSAVQQFLKFPDSLLFSIRCYVKNHGANYEPDRNHPGWASLRKAVKVRDKLTHPKSSSALDLSESDLRCFVEGAGWWKGTMFAMFSACDEADEYWRSELQKDNGASAG